MFYAIRMHKITDAITERQLLRFYSKKDRAAYLEARGDAETIRAKEAHKFTLCVPGYAVHGSEAGTIFFVYRIY